MPEKIPRWKWPLWHLYLNKVLSEYSPHKQMNCPENSSLKSLSSADFSASVPGWPAVQYRPPLGRCLGTAILNQETGHTAYPTTNKRVFLGLHQPPLLSCSSLEMQALRIVTSCPWKDSGSRSGVILRPIYLPRPSEDDANTAFLN